MAERVGFEPTCGECPKTDFEFSPILITAVILRAFSVRFVTLKTFNFPGIFHGKP